MADRWNERFRDGSAEFCGLDDMHKASLMGLGKDDIYLCLFEGRPIGYGGMAGGLVQAGPRVGKGRDCGIVNQCSGVLTGNLVALDVKGEGTFVAQDQTPDGKYLIAWNPLRFHGLGTKSLNPTAHLTRNNPNLIADIKVTVAQAIPKSGSASGEYFEERAREFAAGFMACLAERDEVVMLPSLHATLNNFIAANDAWFDFAYLMHTSRFPHVRRLEAEIAKARNDTSGGFKGILGELLKAFSCLSDPTLLASVSPPFGFTFADLCREDRRYHVALMPPAEAIQIWAPVIKMMFASAMVFKSRATYAPHQTWWIDEAPLLKGFELLSDMYTYGAGLGIRPVTIIQAHDQLKKIASDAETIIPASCGFRLYFGIREYGSAKMLSDTMGDETLHYDDTFQQERSRHARQQALREMLNGGDPIEAGLRAKHHTKQQAHRVSKSRRLMTPDEIINMADNKALLFADGLPGPAMVTRVPYWDLRWMAGRYHPNPYYPPSERVRCKGLIGHHWRNVVERPVEPEFSHLPQYRNGIRSRIEK
ncbi:MAG: type IV secretory system conjugative DNA transfer family protein [Pseudomonadota bacterium]